MAMMDHKARRKKAVRFTGDQGLDGLLVTHLPDVRYLCGFSGSSGMVLLLGNTAHFITDSRYREQARSEVAGAKVLIQDNGFAEALEGILAGRARGGASGGSREGGLGGGAGGLPSGAAGELIIGFDPEHTSYAEVTALRRRLKGKARLKPLKSSLGLLRAPKSRAELEIICEGIAISERAFREAVRVADGTATEAGLAADLDAAARRLGAEAPSFETIVAGGVRGAMAHARPSRNRLAGAAVIDWGVVYRGYRTDCTRTLAFGRVASELRRAHALVLEAQERALEKARPGAAAKEVDLVAREVIEAAGYGKAFGHGLGHGVGLEVHERPHVSRASGDVLEEGMVFTIEPGIYLPGKGGVRVEDMVVVTACGAELLTSLPRTLDPSDYA